MQKRSEPDSPHPVTEGHTSRGPFPTVIVGICILIAAYSNCVYRAEYKAVVNAGKRQPMLADINWSERGMDPNQQDFKPAVLVLAGEYESTNRSGFFEIKMRGRNLYFRREWNSGYSWRWEVESVVTNAWQRFGCRWAGAGVRGIGGGGGEPGELAFVVGRGMWSSNEFVGALDNKLWAEDKSQGKLEEFSELKQYGRYQIPTKIRFRDTNGEKIYRVRKVIVSDQPKAEWFVSLPLKQYSSPSVPAATGTVSTTVIK